MSGTELPPAAVAAGPDTAQQVVTALVAAGHTVGTAESLTGGLVCAALTGVPGASAVVRGAVVAYATELKALVLGVEEELLATGGAVQAEVARQMADGVCRTLGADVGLATTGVAGPDPQDGHPVGTVFVAVALGGRVVVRELTLAGDRATIRGLTVEAVLALLLDLLRDGVVEVGAGGDDGAEDSSPAGG